MPQSWGCRDEAAEDGSHRCVRIHMWSWVGAAHKDNRGFILKTGTDGCEPGWFHFPPAQQRPAQPASTHSQAVRNIQDSMAKRIAISQSRRTMGRRFLYSPSWGEKPCGAEQEWVSSSKVWAAGQEVQLLAELPWHV